MGSAVDVSYANGAYVPGGEDLVIVNASRANIGLAVGSYYARQVDAARSAGKHVGHYFFNGNIDPVACARFFVANLHDYRPGDLLAIDCEYETSTKTVAWNPTQALAFLSTVVALTGASWTQTAVYINRSIRGQWDWSPLWNKGALKWIASPGADPGDWDIWQYDSAGGLDRNHVNDTTLASFTAVPIPASIPEEHDMPKPIYYLAADNGGLSVNVGKDDVWVRNAPGEPLRRITQGQWSDFNTVAAGLVADQDYFYKPGSWFGLAFAEDNLVHGYTAAAHPWMSPAAPQAVDLKALEASIAEQIAAAPAGADQDALKAIASQLTQVQQAIAAVPDAVRENIKAAL